MKITAILLKTSRKKYDLNLVTFNARNAQCHKKSEEKKRKNHLDRDLAKTFAFSIGKATELRNLTMNDRKD